jgi:hypothetical protein
MKLKHLLLLAALATLFTQVNAQADKCVTMSVWDRVVQKDPSALERKAASELAIQNWIATYGNADETQAVITIPVVVHIVYNNQTQNISDAQVFSQISALNEDFRLLNADSVPVGHAFWPNTADSQIEFCLASFDPNGLPTNGITRTSTTHGLFNDANSDDVKFTSLGGKDNWDPTSYLNMWVCNLGSGLYGYATFPSELSTDPDYDGVVIDFEAFGSMGTATAPANLGRTGTHEIGHWLNLSHIWGDDFCGDDLVNDTEPAEESNYGCPTFPYNAFNSCGTGADGEMYMNYMDYVDDNCMNMFTFGQKNRMRAAINGDRSDLLISAGCSGIAAVKDVLHADMIVLSPNPSNGAITLTARNFVPKNATIAVSNALGVEVLRHEGVKSFPFELDLSAMPSDIYFVRISNGNNFVSKKVVITH